MPPDGQQGLFSAADPTLIADRYEIRDRIGRGAFGQVFEVYDRRLKRLVAMKTMPIGPIGDADATQDLRRFYIEARSVARLSHPGIVTVHDFGEQDDFAWIVMELVIGETLKAVLDAGTRPALAETVRVTCDLLEALHHAHGRDIVHRDVKPANILLAQGAGEGLGEVRLADFGIARIGAAQPGAMLQSMASETLDGAPLEGQTLVGQTLGTPATMSPEQLRGEAVDHRADLWSVGVVLYELLTGQKPFPGGIPAIYAAILTADPPPPSSLVPGLPPGFDAVIATALAKRAGDRFADAAAMADAIRAAAMDHTVLAESLVAAEAPLPRVGDDEATLRLIAAVAPQAPVAPSPRPGLGRGFLLGLLPGLALGALAMHSLPPQRRPAPPVIAEVVAAAEDVAEDRLPVLQIAEAPAAPAPEPALITASVDAAPSPTLLETVPPLLDEAPPSPPPEPAVLVPEAQAQAPAPPTPPMAEQAPMAEAPAAPADDAAPVPVLPPAHEALPAVVVPSQALIPKAPGALAARPRPAPVDEALLSPAIPAAAVRPAAAPPLPLAPTPPVATAAPLCAPAVVATRSGTHPGFGRLVFDWQVPVTAALQEAPGGAWLSFAGAACLPAVDRLALPRNLRAVRVDATGDRLWLETAPGARLRQFRLQGRVVVDVTDP